MSFVFYIRSKKPAAPGAPEDARMCIACLFRFPVIRNFRYYKNLLFLMLQKIYKTSTWKLMSISTFSNAETLVFRFRYTFAGYTCAFCASHGKTMRMYKNLLRVENRLRRECYKRTRGRRWLYQQRAGTAHADARSYVSTSYQVFPTSNGLNAPAAR